MSIIPALESVLGPNGVRQPSEAWTDISGDNLGTPLAIVRPETTDQVVQVVAIAREHRVPVVPAGARTAYWTPLNVDGVIAIEVHKLRGISRHDDVVTVGAGEPVRALDTLLRRQGMALPVHPDAFGETSVGAMVASGLTSGMGMARGGIDRWITGLTVVTGAGEILQTGTSAIFDGTGPFMRDGLPDATGLFVGSEGTLGIITEVSLRVTPTPWAVTITGQHSDPTALLHAGRGLCRRGLCDTFRVVREIEPEDGIADIAQAWALFVSVDSLLSCDDAYSRAEHVRSILMQAGTQSVQLRVQPSNERAGEETEADPRWQGPVGSHTEFQRREVLVGMDVNAAYDDVEALLLLANEQALDALSLSASMIRTALYLAPGFVNLGMHTSVARGAPQDTLEAHRTRWLKALAEYPVVPYRPGFSWPPEMLEKRSPAERNTLVQIKSIFDPDGILHPRHPLVAQ
jgi:hypothetical protein